MLLLVFLCVIFATTTVPSVPTATDQVTKVPFESVEVQKEMDHLKALGSYEQLILYIATYSCTVSSTVDPVKSANRFASAVELFGSMYRVNIKLNDTDRRWIKEKLLMLPKNLIKLEETQGITHFRLLHRNGRPTMSLFKIIEEHNFMTRIKEKKRSKQLKFLNSLIYTEKDLFCLPCKSFRLLLVQSVNNRSFDIPDYDTPEAIAFALKGIKSKVEELSAYLYLQLARKDGKQSQNILRARKAGLYLAKLIARRRFVLRDKYYVPRLILAWIGFTKLCDAGNKDYYVDLKQTLKLTEFETTFFFSSDTDYTETANAKLIETANADCGILCAAGFELNPKISSSTVNVKWKPDWNKIFADNKWRKFTPAVENVIFKKKSQSLK
jgi:hypothetical protein